MAIVVRGTAAAARNLPAVMSRATVLVGEVIKAPAALASVSRRIGVAAVPGKVLRAMGNNKITTALVLLELGDVGYDLLKEMGEADADVAEMISRYGVTNDPVEEGTAANLALQADELRCITDAANSVGGLSALHNLRRALGLDEKHYKLYDTVKSLRNTVN